MNKILSLILVIIMMISISACGGSQAPQQNNAAPPDAPSNAPSNAPSDAPPDAPSSTPAPETGNSESAKILVAYFSVPETTNPNNMTRDEENSTVVINGEVLGNTQYVAMLIQENTGADIFRIEPVTPYPTDHGELLDLANDEQSANARPPIGATVENFEQYDVIFVGYPNWYADMPQILYTFMEAYDFSGKTVIPFNTHGGSGFSGTISTIAGLVPTATVERNGFTVSRNVVDSCEGDLQSWLRDLGY